MIKFCWWRHGQKLWHHKLFIKNTFILKRPRVAIFADIIKVVTIFTKTIFKDSKKKKKELEIIIKIQSISVFLHVTKFTDFRWKNADVSRSQGVSYVIHMILGSSLGITVPSFIIVGYIWQVLRRGNIFAPHPWTTPKRPIPNRVKNYGTRYSLDYNLNSRKDKRNCSKLKKRIMSRHLQ